MNSLRVLRRMMLQECGLPARKRPGWPLSQERHPPRPCGPPLRGGDRKSRGDRPVAPTSPQAAKMAALPGACQGRVSFCILPALLAVAALFAGCAVVPLSFHQTLPSTRMALVSLEGAQRSLDDASADYEDSLETASTERPVAAYGATHNAYRRWVTDEVRELPEGLSTITIGGGDT